jgi:sugar phosphate isomerase/epimerase
MRVVAGLRGWTRDFSVDGIDAAIRQITQEDGFDGVSFFYHYPLSELTAADLRRLRDLRHGLGVAYAVHGPFHDQNIGSHYEAMRCASVADICEALDFAAAIGAETVTFHPKMTRYGAAPALRAVVLPRARQQEERSLREIAAHAERAGAVACYENMDPTDVHFPENVDPVQVLALVAPHAGPSLGITYDPAHAYVGHHDPVAAVHVLGPAIYHVHWSDNDASIDQHYPLGQGTIDFPAILSALREVGYSGLIELELGAREEYLASQHYLQERCGLASRS